MFTTKLNHWPSIRRFHLPFLIISAVMFLQTVVSFSPFAGFVGGSLCNAEEELGALWRQWPVWGILCGLGLRNSKTHWNKIQDLHCTRWEIWSQRYRHKDMEWHGWRARLRGKYFRKISIDFDYVIDCFLFSQITLWLFSLCGARKCQIREALSLP